jgi:hypothetical protein
VKINLFKLGTLLLICGLFFGGAARRNTFAATATPTAVPTRGLPSGGLQVQGNQLVDGSGQAFLLRGAQVDSSFNNTRVKEGPESELFQATQHLTATAFGIMHKEWNMNMLRLPITNWIWQDDPDGYLDRVESVVKQANDAGLVVVLALYSDREAGSPYYKGDTKMPTDEAVAFWQAVAGRFKDYPFVIFDLFD